MTDPLSTTRRLIAIFDAIADAPDTIGAGLSLHDRDGTLVKTFKSWASARGFEVKRTTLTADLSGTGEHVTWDQFRFTAENGSEVCVHDMASQRAAAQVENDSDAAAEARTLSKALLKFADGADKANGRSKS